MNNPARWGSKGGANQVGHPRSKRCLYPKLGADPRFAKPKIQANPDTNLTVIQRFALDVGARPQSQPLPIAQAASGGFARAVAALRRRADNRCDRARGDARLRFLRWVHALFSSVARAAGERKHQQHHSHNAHVRISRLCGQRYSPGLTQTLRSIWRARRLSGERKSRENRWVTVAHWVVGSNADGNFALSVEDQLITSPARVQFF
jgi:hypothetical protein